MMESSTWRIGSQTPQWLGRPRRRIGAKLINKGAPVTRITRRNSTAQTRHTYGQLFLDRGRPLCDRRAEKLALVDRLAQG
jgi:hypothetical protein